MATTAQHAGPRHSSLRHPVRALEDEAHFLLEIEQRGDEPATPFIAIAMVASVILPILAVMMLLAFGAGWLFG